MALLRPFRALRPNPDRAAAVAAVPYDVVTTDEARSLAAGRPLSFLHVSRAEVDLPGGTGPYEAVVYERAKENFASLIRDAPLVREQHESLYIYRLEADGHAQTGLAATFSLDEYDRDLILKHEKTRKDKEDDRTRHILELKAQTGPVFLTYRPSAEVEALTSRVTGSQPALLDFTADDGVRHAVWRATAGEAAALVAAFARIPRLYIADGHHRAASAARARQALRAGGSDAASPSDFFLAVAFPHDQVRILAYNRVVKDLGGRTPGAVLEALRRTHQVVPGAPVPERRGEVSMLLAGTWYSIALDRPATATSPIATLDASLLHDQVLGPILGIGDITTDPRIDFVGGARGTAALEQAVGRGAAVAFSLYPVSVSDLMAVSDAGEIMPPKSTWFEPKLRDGLVIHEIA